MKKTARTPRQHRASILNYFRAQARFSGGVIEGLNDKAKVAGASQLSGSSPAWLDARNCRWRRSGGSLPPA
jgi:hypothetical protein